MRYTGREKILDSGCCLLLRDRVILRSTIDEAVPEEAHFGVVRFGSLEPKPAYAALAAQMRRDAQ